MLYLTATISSLARFTTSIISNWTVVFTNILFYFSIIGFNTLPLSVCCFQPFLHGGRVF